MKKIVLSLLMMFTIAFSTQFKCVNEKGNTLEFNKYKKNSVVLNDVAIYNVQKTFDTKNYAILEMIVDNTMIGTLQILKFENSVIFHLNGDSKEQGYTSQFKCN